MAKQSKKISIQIKEILKDGNPYSQKEISKKLHSIDRAILIGYLRCLVDLGQIHSKDLGRTKIYFIKKGVKK